MFRIKCVRVIENLKDWYRWNVKWSRLPRAEMIAELSLDNWGGCQLFIDDINDDGKPEFLWLQTAGIFKSAIYSQGDSPRAKYLSSHGQDLFCLTATDQAGKVLWQVGRPYEGGEPYLSHAPEKMLCCYDVDGDGHTEILALRSDELLLLDGSTGALRNTARLPSDNFSVVACGRSGPQPSEVVVLVGVMADAYPPFDYANPWLFLDGSFQLTHQGEYLGAGHHVAVFDADGDARDEFLIGYQLADCKGEVLWTVDQWTERTIDPIRQHVDHVEICWIGNRWFAALSGSDKQYWIDSTGRALWSHELSHPQFCTVCRSDSELVVFVFNQRESMNCFNRDGKEIWHGLLPENWPMGRPSMDCKSRPIHSGVPAAILRAGDKAMGDLIIYSEGGWPYALNPRGEAMLMFPFTERARKSNIESPSGRINNIGLSFEIQVHDLDGDGREEVVIYDRQHAWLYTLGEKFYNSRTQ